MHKRTGLQSIQHTIGSHPFNTKLPEKDKEDDSYLLLKATEHLISEWVPIERERQKVDPIAKPGQPPAKAVNALSLLHKKYSRLAVSILKHTHVPWVDLAKNRSYITSLANHVYRAISNQLVRTSKCLKQQPVWDMRMSMQRILKKMGVTFEFWDMLENKPVGGVEVATDDHDTGSALLVYHNGEILKRHARGQIQKMLDAILQRNVTCILNSNDDLVLLPEFKDALDTMLKVSSRPAC
jgi:hypothetical protein